MSKLKLLTTIAMPWTYLIIHFFLTMQLYQQKVNLSFMAYHSQSPPKRLVVHCSFLAWTSLLMSLKVVSIAGLGAFAFKLGQPPWARHSSPSCPSFAAFMYLKNRRMSGLSDDGFRSSFSSLEITLNELNRINEWT